MLAGIEEALQAERIDTDEEEMTAIEALLTGLFDYAGLYPPASLDLATAVRNYTDYRRGERAWALGRFIVNLDRIDELRTIAGSAIDDWSLSVIATRDSDWDGLAGLIRSGVRIDAVEIKCRGTECMERVIRSIPETYFEVSSDAAGRDALKSVTKAGARAKLRMGGVVADAFPPTEEVAPTLKALAEIGLPFKATAGLHHPLRGARRLTYQQESPTGTMHGFVNLSCAAAVIYFDGETSDAIAVLSEQDPSSFGITSTAIQWRERSWTVDQLAEVRRRFLISIGSCSFEEPIQDLERLKWL
jgi:hypothetical protein